MRWLFRTVVWILWYKAGPTMSDTALSNQCTTCIVPFLWCTTVLFCPSLLRSAFVAVVFFFFFGAVVAFMWFKRAAGLMGWWLVDGH